MPRFFFNIRDHEVLIKDLEGSVMRNTEAARAEALLSARELLRTSDMTVRRWFGHTYEIVDEDGRLVLSLPFSDALDIAA